MDKYTFDKYVEKAEKAREEVLQFYKDNFLDIGNLALQKLGESPLKTEKEIIEKLEEIDEATDHENTGIVLFEFREKALDEAATISATVQPSYFEPFGLFDIDYSPVYTEFLKVQGALATALCELSCGSIACPSLYCIIVEE